MVDRSMEEIHLEAVEAMGETLGTLYFELWDQIVWLHMKWQEYGALFGNRNRLDVLNEVARQFAFVVQHTLNDDILLHLCRLTDAPGKPGKKNLTVRALPGAISADTEVRRAIEDAVSAAVKATQFARGRRDKRISHLDLPTVLGQGARPLEAVTKPKIQAAVDALRNVVNVLVRHYGIHAEGDWYISYQFGAENLMFYVEQGLRAVKEEGENVRRLSGSAGND